MPQTRQTKLFLTTLVAFGLLLGLAVPAQVQEADYGVEEMTAAPRGTTSPSKSANGKYIVRMAEAPVVAYRGGIPGLRATRPAKGAKINPHSPDVVKYAAYLDSRHDAALGRVGGGRKLYDYRYSFNGFAAELTRGQAAQLASTPGVVSVEADRPQTVDTATTATFLGLDAAGTGLWNQLGGVGSAGEDVIIGILDSGVWPEHPSFSDRTGVGPNGQEGKLGYQQIPGWHGKCMPGEAFTASDCNHKLIGAQYFYEGQGGAAAVLPHEFLSARDYHGHGTHTASTAGGNHATPITGLASALGTATGIAPRARIAAYKVCWENGAGNCLAFPSDSVAAIDQAVADGVDVINYSISGTRTNYLDPVEVAYLFAADAGVFVATSAGNSGPTASTVAHIGPWLAATANGTHNRTGFANVTLGNSAAYTGASLTPGVGPAAVVRAQDAGVAGAHPDILRQCFSADPTNGNLPPLDPAKVAGKIVLCERGGPGPVVANLRIDKSLAVKNAGGVGMILANVTANTLNADIHSVPTVHVSHLDGPSIAAYVTGAPTPTAALSQGVVSLTAPAPDISSSSSRGPSLAGGGDILKPDFMAPGTDILAAVAPPGNAGKLFDLYNGTSMASPHVAGIAALLTQAHPDWSPAAMRSAIATTASPAALSATSPLAIGAGQVRPNLAVDPGLVYDAGLADYLAFLKGQGLCCGADPSVPTLDASNLNQPSLAVGDLPGFQTLTRTVKNVGATAATYSATVAAPLGFTVSVSPSSFTIAPGATQTYTATITRTTAPFNLFRFGSLTWSDGTHNVRSQIAVRPVSVSAPAELTAAGAAGSLNWTITTGYAGALALEKRGLIPAVTAAAYVTDDPDDSFDTANPASPSNAGVTAHTVVIPAGTTYSRVALFDDFTDGADDLDLYVYNSSGTLVGSSAGVTSAETVNLVNPAAGTYTVYVHGWQTDETAGGPGANYTLFSWVLGSADAGNLTVSGPASAALAVTSPVNLSWSGLAPATKYLGAIAYKEGATTHATTLLRIDTP